MNCAARSLFSTFISRPVPHHVRHFSSSGIRGVRFHYVRFGGGGGPDRKQPFANPNTLKAVGIITGLGGIYYYTNLEQVPETGRWRFMNISPKLEEKIGKMARKETYEESQGRILPADHTISRHVRRVVSRLLVASNLGTVRGEGPDATDLDTDTWDGEARLDSDSTRSVREWDIIVVNDQKMVNAAAVPGLIIVWTGILPVCENEEGLAAALSHEIGHIVARHTAEKVSLFFVALVAMTALQALGLDFGISNFATDLLVNLPNSRTMEHEADSIGLRILAKACYDPENSPAMMQRLATMEGKQGRFVSGFLRTHPTGKHRIERLVKQLPEAYDILAANPDCRNVHDIVQGFKKFTPRDDW